MDPWTVLGWLLVAALGFVLLAALTIFTTALVVSVRRTPAPKPEPEPEPNDRLIRHYLASTPHREGSS